MIRTPTIATIAALLVSASASAADQPMASGVSFSYISSLAGAVELGGSTHDWDQGQRFEVQFRDYYFPRQSHHPFYELGLILEKHSLDADAVSVDAEAWGVKAAIGTAVPLWIGEAAAVGIAPQLGMHLGRVTVDTSRQGGSDTSGSALRYGLSAGCDGWAILSRSVTFGAGPFASYWRAGEVDVADAGGGTSGTRPSGWDIGIRALVGVVF